MVRYLERQFTREDAAEAPADDADLLLCELLKLFGLSTQRRECGLREAEVPSLIPDVRVVAQLPKCLAQRCDCQIVLHESRHDQNRMSVAPRQQADEGTAHHEETELRNGSVLHRQQEGMRWHDVRVEMPKGLHWCWCW